MIVVLDVGGSQPYASIQAAVGAMTSLADHYVIVLHDTMVADSGVVISAGFQVTIRAFVPSQPVVWLIHEVVGVNDPLEYGLRVEGASASGSQTNATIQDVVFVVGLVSLTPTHLDASGTGTESGRALQVDSAVVTLVRCGTVRLVLSIVGPTTGGGWRPCTLVTATGIGGQLFLQEFAHFGGNVSQAVAVFNGGVHAVFDGVFLNLFPSFQLGLIPSPSDTTKVFMRAEHRAALVVSDSFLWGMSTFGVHWWGRGSGTPQDEGPAGLSMVNVLCIPRSSGTTRGVAFWPTQQINGKFLSTQLFGLFVDRCGFLGRAPTFPVPGFKGLELSVSGSSASPFSSTNLSAEVRNCVFARIRGGVEVTGALTLLMKIHNCTFVWPGGATVPGPSSIEFSGFLAPARPPSVVVANNIFVGGDFPSLPASVTNSFGLGVAINFSTGTGSLSHPLPGIDLSNNLFSNHPFTRRIRNAGGGSEYAAYDAAAAVPNLSVPWAGLRSLPPAVGSPPENLRPWSTSLAVDAAVTVVVPPPNPALVVPPAVDALGVTRAPKPDIGALEAR